MSALALALMALVLLVVAALLPWCASQIVHSLVRHWRESPPASTGFNPLLEMVQPKAHHIVEVQEQRQKHDHDGSPPHPAAN